VQGDVGPPPCRPGERLEVEQRQLAAQLDDQAPAKLGCLEPVKVRDHELPDQVKLVVDDRRRGVPGQLPDQIAEEQVLVGQRR
jgi:hypothetical protein